MNFQHKAHDPFYILIPSVTTSPNFSKIDLNPTPPPHQALQSKTKVKL